MPEKTIVPYDFEELPEADRFQKVIRYKRTRNFYSLCRSDQDIVILGLAHTALNWAKEHPQVSVACCMSPSVDYWVTPIHPGMQTAEDVFAMSQKLEDVLDMNRKLEIIGTGKSKPYFETYGFKRVIANIEKTDPALVEKFHAADAVDDFPGLESCLTIMYCVALREMKDLFDSFEKQSPRSKINPVVSIPRPSNAATHNPHPAG